MKKFISQILFSIKCFFSKNAEALENMNLIEHVDDELEKSKKTFDSNVETAAKFLLTLNKTKETLQSKKEALDKKNATYVHCIAEIKNGNEKANGGVTWREVAASCLKEIKTLEFEVNNIQSVVDSLEQKYAEMIKSLKELKKGIDNRAIDIECLKSQNAIVELKKAIASEFDVKFEEGSCSQYYNKLKDKIKLTMNEMDIKSDLEAATITSSADIVEDIDINAKIDADIAKSKY